MSLGGKVFTTVWEQLFQIFFPGGFLTVEFGWYFALGALAISSITLFLQINVLEKKVLFRRVIVNLCLLAVTLFIPALLGFVIGILVSGAFYSIKQHPDLPLVNKIAIGVLNALGILGLLGVCGIFIFFWRFLVAYMLVGGFIVGLLIYIVPIAQTFVNTVFQQVTKENFKKIAIISGIVFVVLGGLFASFGFIRPFKAAPESYSPSGTMNVTLATYNIRLGTGREENQYDLWKERKDDLADYIDGFDADFICIQEAYHFQIRYLIRTLTTRDYKYVGAGRDDGVISGEHACIFFDSSKYQVITGGNFWLSDYPYYPSQTWNGVHDKDRVVAWARFEEIATQDQLFVLSVHYDSGEEFREKANVLLNERVAEYSGDIPVIVGGDFNYNSSMSGWNLMENYGSKPLQSAYHLIHGPGPHLIDTTNSFDLTYDNPINMIDFIFVSADISPTSCEVLQDAYTAPDGLAHYYSDHFPVIMQCVI